MDTRSVAAIGVALVIAYSVNPAVASCLAAPVKDDNPTGGMRTGLARPSADELWVSGTISLKDQTTYPYVERFDPINGWSRSVLSSQRQSAFNSIAALAAGRAMAVGFEKGGASALAVMFDGSRWFDTLDASSRLRFRGSLQKIAAVPSTESAYAVLAYGSVNLLHWDGATWSAVSDALPLGGVLSVGASSPNDVWAVGGWTNRYGIVRGLVERYHDGRWTQSDPPAKLTMLTGVVVKTSDNVWVTGLTQQGSSFVPYAARWNGSSWRQISLPLHNAPSVVFGDVYVQSDSNVWISASQWQRGESLSSLWHWNGRGWGFVLGSTAWTNAPLLAGYPGDVWFAAGQYRHTRFDGNRWMGTAACEQPTV